MRKKIALIALSLLILSLPAACAVGKGTPAPTATAAASADGGMAGSDFNRTYVMRFSDVGMVLMDMVSDEAFKDWVDPFVNGTRDPAECNMLTFVTEFDIGKDALLEEIGRYVDRNITSREEIFRLTDGEIDILYSGDLALIRRTFVHPAAILFDDSIRPARWFAETSLDQIRNEGIPAELIAAKAGIWANDGSLYLTEGQRETLRVKADAYRNAVASPKN